MSQSKLASLAKKRSLATACKRLQHGASSVIYSIVCYIFLFLFPFFSLTRDVVSRFFLLTRNRCRAEVVSFLFFTVQSLLVM